jgi:hypothetical protein
MDYLNKFNITFNEFIEDISSLFPEDSDFTLYKTALKTAISLDKKLAYNTFNTQVIEKYSTQILNRDETFFLEHQYSIVNIKKEYSSIIDKIKSYWSSMNEENKNIVWKYLKVLILLSNKIKETK